MSVEGFDLRWRRAEATTGLWCRGRRLGERRLKTRILGSTLDLADVDRRAAGLQRRRQENARQFSLGHVLVVDCNKSRD